MDIRQAANADRDAVLSVERQAFGAEKGPEIEALVDGLLADPTALPLISLLASDGGRPVGHVLFTSVHIDGADRDVTASILAPLAVIPSEQGRGIGGLLVREGLRLLSEAEVELVFVLGHPGYYPRHGFTPAGVLGFSAPYPIPEEHAGAWMMQELRPGAADGVSGCVVCADTLNSPEHWRE